VSEVWPILLIFYGLFAFAFSSFRAVVNNHPQDAVFVGIFWPLHAARALWRQFQIWRKSGA
jgi:hypothetical protein